LRSAMLSMRSSDAWSHPAYWGNFYIVGDWTQTVH
jgi:CHAT domain-containing protein